MSSILHHDTIPIAQQLKELEKNPTLQQLYDISWNILYAGTKNRHLMSRLMQVTTFDEEQKRMDTRTVVSRSVDSKKQLLRFHTDTRSPKWISLEQHHLNQTPVAIHFYDAPLKMQIRLQAHVHLLVDAQSHNDLQNNTWQSLTKSQKQTYSLPYVSRETIKKPILLKEMNFLSDEIAQQNFAYIDLKVIEMDTLYLSAFGHIRAIFQGNNLTDQRFVNY